MSERIPQIAKAITAALTPIVVALVAGLLDRAGIDVPVDPTAVETIVSSVVLAVLVWAVPNTPKES